MKKLTIMLLSMCVLSYTHVNAAKEKPSTIIKKEININASIDKAWQVLGPQFADAQKWASSISHSEGRGEGMNGAACSERGCGVVGIGEVQERILKYSDDEHLLSYQVYDGMPKMVKYASNTWKLIRLEDGTTKLEMQMELKTGGMMGAMMKGMMKKKMAKMADEVVEEFKYYVENGKPHPRKVEALQK